MGICEELGVKRIINGAATLTAIGAQSYPGVLDSMKGGITKLCIHYELQHKAGAQIAKWTNNEQPWYPTGGSRHSSGKACIAGDDEEKRRQLPHTDGMKNEVVVYGPQRVDDFAIRQAGGKSNTDLPMAQPVRSGSCNNGQDSCHLCIYLSTVWTNSYLLKRL